MTLRETLRSKPKCFILPIALVLTGLIAFFDSRTRWEISFFVFYAIPIFVVGCTYPKRVAFGFAVGCAALVWAVNLRLAPSMPIHSWRSVNRLVAYSFVAGAGAALRMQKEQFRSRLEALQRSSELEQQIKLEQEIIRISEREQRRIGQDLHDSVCQNLAAIKYATGLLRKKLETKAPEEAKTAGEIKDLLRKTLIEARSLARGIFPVQIEKEGLAMAIEELAATANRIHGQQVSIEIDGEIDIKEPETVMHLYRIAQEALSNALRHAKAGTIGISLRQDPQHCTLAIKDDGSGIGANHSNGMGLRTIQYRARLIGGELVIRDNEPSGTLVQCCIPLSGHASQS